MLIWKVVSSHGTGYYTERVIRGLMKIHGVDSPFDLEGLNDIQSVEEIYLLDKWELK